MMKHSITEVVAALIWDHDKFMICQRPAHKARGLLWEFVGEVFMDVIHEDPDLTVHLTLFHATIREGTPQKLEHNDIRWITVDEIDQYAFCPADEEILKRLKQTY